MHPQAPTTEGVHMHTSYTHSCVHTNYTHCSLPPQHPKSTVAANAAKKMNPAFMVVAHENRVGGDTESILVSVALWL